MIIDTCIKRKAKFSLSDPPNGWFRQGNDYVGKVIENGKYMIRIGPSGAVYFNQLPFPMVMDSLELTPVSIKLETTDL
jgi:hypothetical protein